MDISASHKQLKIENYWDDLVHGTTGQYKENAIDRLLAEHFPPLCTSILDIGCGTCDLIIKYGNQLNANRLFCADYDENIINQMKLSYPDARINWHVADIFQLENWSERFELVFLLDMLHEIYSFYGRHDRNLNQPIDHQLGQKYVKDAICNIASITKSGGAVVITDNVLCPENIDLKVQIKNPDALNAINYLFKHYPTRQFDVLINDDILSIKSHDFCVLLTQYNKIKQEQWERWNVERFETHQYMTLEEYEKMFAELDFIVHAIVGTPKVAYDEWSTDFKILDGLSEIPDKRITLLALKR